jgi:hypothetical protein
MPCHRDTTAGEGSREPQIFSPAILFAAFTGVWPSCVPSKLLYHGATKPSFVIAGYLVWLRRICLSPPFTCFSRVTCRMLSRVNTVRRGRSLCVSVKSQNDNRTPTRTPDHGPPDLPNLVLTLFFFVYAGGCFSSALRVHKQGHTS